MKTKNSAGHETQVSVRTIFRWSSIVLPTVVAATFAITKYASSEHTATLRTALEAATQREQDVLQKLHTLTARESSERQAPILPDVTIEAAGDSADLKELATRISKLEEERDQLLNQLAQGSQDALEPSSELATLIRQLSSKEPELRKQAVRGLMELKDPRSATALTKYFYEQTDELHPGGLSIYDWLNGLRSIEPRSAMRFAIQLLESDNEYFADAAYFMLCKEDLNAASIEQSISTLEGLALRSENSLTRTRAKLLVKEYSGRFKARTDEGRREDSRSLYQVLYDIEKAVKSLSDDKLKRDARKPEDQ